MYIYEHMIECGVRIKDNYLSESDITNLYCSPTWVNYFGPFAHWQQYLKQRGNSDFTITALTNRLTVEELTMTEDTGTLYEPNIELWLHPTIAGHYANFLMYGLTL